MFLRAPAAISPKNQITPMFLRLPHKISIQHTQSITRFLCSTANQKTKTPARLLSLVLRDVSIVLGGILFAGGLSLVVMHKKMSKDELAYPFPGQLIETPSAFLHVMDTKPKNERATIVFEGGSGSLALDWEKVVKMLDDNLRCIRYDRAGLGFSSPGAPPRDSSTIASELDELLHSLNVRGPVIFVSHAIGSLYTRTFLHKYGHKYNVKGLILVDPVVEGVYDDLKSISPSVKRYVEEQEGGAKLLKRLAPFGIARLIESFESRKLYAIEKYPQECVVAARIAYMKDSHREGIWEESKAEVIKASEEAVKDTNKILCPLIVLGHSKPIFGSKQSEVLSDEQKKMESVWEAAQSSLTSLSQVSIRKKVPYASHNIHTQFPQAIADGIDALVSYSEGKIEALSTYESFF